MSKVVMLKELLTIKNGKEYRHLQDGDIPVYGTGGIMTYIDTFLYDGESILLPRKGSLDNICYVNGKFWTVDTMYWSIVNTDKVYAKYLYCYLSLLDLSCRDSGSTLPSMTFDSYYSLPIKLPSFDIQKKIGDWYFTLDAKISTNNAINAELEAMAKTIYDYWFLQFEFPDENGKPYKSSGGKMVWNDELRREIPEGWEITHIGAITKCLDSTRIPLSGKDRETKKGSIPYYGATGIMDYVDEAIFDGDYVLMAEDGSVMDDNGNPILQRITGKAWVNNHAHVLKPINGYNCKLLMLLLKDVQVATIKTGSIQMKINQEKMNNIAIPSIPARLLNQSNDIFNRIDQQQLLLLQENQELASLRDFLLPLLMNGQVGFQD